MSDARRFQLDELTIRPGTYFNPQTEILIVVDDSPEVDHEIFDMDDFEATDWVLISDDSPVDEDKRDENSHCWARPHPENVARRQSAGYIEHLESGRLDLYR